MCDEKTDLKSKPLLNLPFFSRLLRILPRLFRVAREVRLQSLDCDQIFPSHADGWNKPLPEQSPDCRFRKAGMRVSLTEIRGGFADSAGMNHSNFPLRIVMAVRQASVPDFLRRFDDFPKQKSPARKASEIF